MTDDFAVDARRYEAFHGRSPDGATAAPLADTTNWLCLALGVLSAISLVAYLRAHTSGAALGSGSEGG